MGGWHGLPPVAVGRSSVEVAPLLSRLRPLEFGSHLYRRNRQNLPTRTRESRNSVYTVLDYPVLKHHVYLMFQKVFGREKCSRVRLGVSGRAHGAGTRNPSKQFLIHTIEHLRGSLFLSFIILCCGDGANWEEEFLLFSNDDPKNEPLTE